MSEHDDWRHRAACRDADPERFQPDVVAQDDLEATVREFCLACPVLEQCHDLAASTEAYGLHAGVWWGPEPAEPAPGGHCAWDGEALPEGSQATYCSGRCRKAAQRARQETAAA